MTEKRFKNVEEKLDWGTIQYFTYNNEKLTDDEIEDLVNQLLEENEQLKQANLEEELDYYKAKCGSCEEGLFEKDRKIAKLEKEKEELKFKLEESNSDKEYVKQVIKDRIKHYHSYSCINKTDIDNGCIGLKIELEHFYDDVEPYLEESK